SLMRIVDHQRSRRLTVAWAVGQSGAVAIYTFLYFTHLSKVKPRIAFWEIPFEQYYFHWRDGDLYFFLRQNTWNIFLYIFKERYVSEVVLLLFVLGVRCLFVRGLFPSQGNSRSFHLAILVTVPFIANWGGAVAGIYPYISSRHSILLAPAEIPASSVL